MTARTLRRHAAFLIAAASLAAVTPHRASAQGAKQSESGRFAPEDVGDSVVPQLRRSLRPEKAPDRPRARLAEQIETSAIDLLDPSRQEARATDMRLMDRNRVHHVGLLVGALVLSAI